MIADATPSIRIALRDYRFFINQATLFRLGRPVYLQFLYEDERKLLAILGADEKKEYSFLIPERIYRETDGECCVNRMALTEAFRMRMNWDKRHNYRIEGTFCPKIDAVLFNLTEAVITGSSS